MEIELKSVVYFYIRNDLASGPGVSEEVLGEEVQLIGLKCPFYTCALVCR